jgi:hypothetical protein
MKILNIDDYAEANRKITIKGISYPIEEPTVQQFIDNMKAAELLESSGQPETMVRSFEQAVVAVNQAIPSLPLQQIRELKLHAMTAILQFIRGEFQGNSEAQAESEANVAKIAKSDEKVTDLVEKKQS